MAYRRHRMHLTAILITHVLLLAFLTCNPGYGAALADVVSLVVEPAPPAPGTGRPGLVVRAESETVEEVEAQVRVWDYSGAELVSEQCILSLKPPTSVTYRWRPGTGRYVTTEVTLSCPGNESLTRREKLLCDRLDGMRKRVSLAGEWHYLPLASESDFSLDHSQAWESVQLPNTEYQFLGQEDRHAAVFRRYFTVPDQMRGERGFIWFEMVHTKAVVFVNGQRVHTNYNAWSPFEVDITECQRFGQQNELVVLTVDDTGVADLAARVPTCGPFIGETWACGTKCG